ncbi:MAG: alpha-amylase [Lewinellaceae bacterium]|nr:alpha-amylase [Lewinellaceae bacterium]
MFFRKLFPAFLLFLLLFSCKKEPIIPVPETFVPPAVEDIVMYEINLRAFSQAGNFQGIIARMDTLKALGINTIWLMPIHPVGQVNSVGQLGSPYSVQNYREVNPEFGTLDDFLALVEAAHQREIAVVIDWVANHTAWDNPWIQENPDWYTQDGDGNIVHPPGTNWMDVADLNYNKADMRLAMIDAMKYWVTETGVDGFRCDAADMVPYSFWKQAIDSLHSIPDRRLILLAEGNRSDHFTAGFQMNYGWDFYTRLKAIFAGANTAETIFSAQASELNSLPEGAKKLRFTTNHDETAWDKTPIQLFGGKQGALAASVITMYIGGVPLLYNGQEVGLDVNLPFFSRYPIDWTLNPDMAATYRKLTGLYNEQKALRKGMLTTYPAADIVAFKRSLGNQEVLVLVNVRNMEKTLSVDPLLIGSQWTDVLDNSPVSLPETLDFQPYEFRILTPS